MIKKISVRLDLLDVNHIYLYFFNVD